MYTPPCRGRAGRPRVRPGGSPRPPPGRPPWARFPPAAAGSGPRGRRAARPAARPGPGRAGRGRGRWRGCACAPSSSATCSLARIISRSISRWDSVWGTPRAPITLPLASKRNSGSKDSTSRLVATRRSPSAAAASRATASGSATASGGSAAAGEHQVELVVVEAGVGADPAAVEARPACDAVAAELDLRGHREPLHPRRQAARLLAERVREHRLDGARDVGAVRSAGAPHGPAASRAARGRRRRRCGSRAACRRPRAGPRPRRRSRAPSPGRR